MDDDSEQISSKFDLSPLGGVVVLLVFSIVAFLAVKMLSQLEELAWCTCFGHR